MSNIGPSFHLAPIQMYGKMYAENWAIFLPSLHIRPPLDLYLNIHYCVIIINIIIKLDTNIFCTVQTITDSSHHRRSWWVYKIRHSSSYFFHVIFTFLLRNLINFMTYSITVIIMWQSKLPTTNNTIKQKKLVKAKHEIKLILHTFGDLFYFRRKISTKKK